MNQHCLTSSASLTPVLTAPSPSAPCLGSVAYVAVAHVDDDESDGAQLRERVRNYVRTRLLTPPNARELATALAMTSRTLQRRLQRAQTSIRDLIAQVRIEVACDMLRNSNVAIQDIAAAVGFAQPASFTRAFVAATGQTPIGYRRDGQADQAPATHDATIAV